MVDPAEIENTRAWGHAHIRRGWAVFLLSTDDETGKNPLKNCARCHPVDGTCRDRENCECLTCHSFYAATRDPLMFDRMLAAAPHGHLAVRTGRASRLLVLDAEAHADEGAECSGLEALDRLEEYTGGLEAPETLTAVTAHGGRHLYYHLPPEAPLVQSRNRVLPGVDVKCEGGLVVAVGSRSGKRVWLRDDVPVRTPSRGLLEWLAAARGKRGGGAGGGGSGGDYDFRRFYREGCPGGHRNAFFNDLGVWYKRQGVSLENALDRAVAHWHRVAQPPLAVKECLWEHVEYQIRRVYNDHRVEVDDDAFDPVGLLNTWNAARSAQKVRPLSRNSEIVSF